MLAVTVDSPVSVSLLILSAKMASVLNVELDVNAQLSCLSRNSLFPADQQIQEQLAIVALKVKVDSLAAVIVQIASALMGSARAVEMSAYVPKLLQPRSLKDVWPRHGTT